MLLSEDCGQFRVAWGFHHGFKSLQALSLKPPESRTIEKLFWVLQEKGGQQPFD